MVRQVQVTVPASSANLGPGFDCLGLALALYNQLTVSESKGDGLEIRIRGEGAGVLPQDERCALYQAMQQVFAAARYRPGRLLLEACNQIPVGCGLGSSAAAWVAGLAAGMVLSGEGVDQEQLIVLSVAAEGHGDNVIPCLLGGFTVVCSGGDRIRYLRLDPPSGLRAVVVVPDFSLSTRQARAVLPAAVPFREAVLNQGRVALLTAAIASNRLELLKEAMEDCLHQPYRAGLVPGLEEVRQAALQSGALGAALSGAGPAMLALVRQEEGVEQAIGAAMQAAWRRRGIASRCLVLQVDRGGVQVDVRAETERG